MWHINDTNSLVCNPQQEISAFPVDYRAWLQECQVQFHNKVTTHSLEFKPFQKEMDLPPLKVSPLGLHHSLSLTFMPIPVSPPVHLPLPQLWHWQEFEGWGEKNILKRVFPEHEAFFSWIMHHTCFCVRIVNSNTKFFEVQNLLPCISVSHFFMLYWQEELAIKYSLVL